MGIVIFFFFDRLVVFGLALTASPTPSAPSRPISSSPDSTTPPIQARSNNAFVRNCRVYAGPVVGSILIDEAYGCVFVMASHQITIKIEAICDQLLVAFQGA
jgi:hypothetical protein